MAMVAAAVAGPRYGVYMPIEDQQKIAGGGEQDKQRGIMTLLQAEREKTVEIDELYLYKVRKLIKRELTQNNVESGLDLPLMIMGTVLMTLCFCLMNSIGLNAQFDLFSQHTRYNANFGFINTLLSGALSGLLCYLCKKYLFRTNVGNHLFDVRALCNGFLAGAVGVSVGSAGMQPYLAMVAGLISAPCYFLGGLLFRAFQIDDPLENCQIYILPIIWSTFNSALFQDTEGILVPKTENQGADLLGVQVLSLSIITALATVLSWIYFFPMKRLNSLKVPRSIEVLGRDAIMNANSKGLDLKQLIEKIEAVYPEPKKRGC